MTLHTWNQAFTDAFTHFWSKLAGFLPNFIATLFIVFIGLYLTRLTGVWLGKLLHSLGTDKLCDRIGISSAMRTAGFTQSPSTALAGLIRIFLILLIILSAAETLGLHRVSAVVDQFVLYLPKILGAIIVLIGGMFVGHHIRKSVASAMGHLGVDYGKAISQVVYGIVLVITFSLAIGQLEIKTQLFDLFFGILVACIGLATALSLGLGARDISSHLVSGVYLREQLMAGDFIIFDDVKGTVIAVGSINTVIEKEDQSLVRIPNSMLVHKRFETHNDYDDETPNKP